MDRVVIFSIVSLVFTISCCKASDPFLSQDEVEEVFGPVSSSILEEAKEAIGPITPSTLDETLEDAKEALGPVSPSTIVDDAKGVLGPSSSQVLDKAKHKFESWISQNKQDASSSSEAQKEDEQNKHSSLLEEAEKEFGPIASIDIDPADDAEGPISSKEEESIDSSSGIDEKEIGPVSSFDLEEDEVSQTKAGPISSAPSPSPTSPSSFDDAKKALDAAKEEFSSLFSVNKAAVETSYFDHDVALAIESLIKQGKSKSELAIEEAKKQVSDDSDKGKCMKKCMENYASCIRHLDKAMEDLRGRKSEFLTDDVSAVDGEISACQTCFLENQSPLKDLEDAIVKAARECLNVLDHSA